MTKEEDLLSVSTCNLFPTNKCNHIIKMSYQKNEMEQKAQALAFMISPSSPGSSSDCFQDF
jgi:hypothetical protein